MYIIAGNYITRYSIIIQVQATLFDTLSDYSTIDHPLCDECTDALLEMLEQQVRLAEDDYQDYCKYLKKLESEPQDVRLGDLEKELEDLRKEEERLIGELTALQEEEKATLGDIAEQEEIARRLGEEEERYWQEYTKLRKDYMQTDDEFKRYAKYKIIDYSNGKKNY